MNDAYNTPVIVSLNVTSCAAATLLASKLDPVFCRVRVGMELFVSAGPAVVKDLQMLGFDVFLDLQFKGGPGVVAGAIKAACDLGVWMISVHADGGTEMMRAAMNVAHQARHPRPRIIAATVPTSMNADDLEEVGVIPSSAGVRLQVLRLARLAAEAGLDGVLAPWPMEARLIRGEVERDFLVIIPNIRLLNEKMNEQQRVITPEMAVESSANYFVVGQSITEAFDDPMATVMDFNTRACSAQSFMM